MLRLKGLPMKSGEVCTCSPLNVTGVC